jgi:hypothetical protein
LQETPPGRAAGPCSAPGATAARDGQPLNNVRRMGTLQGDSARYGAVRGAAHLVCVSRPCGAGSQTWGLRLVRSHLPFKQVSGVGFSQALPPRRRLVARNCTVEVELSALQPRRRLCPYRLVPGRRLLRPTARVGFSLGVPRRCDWLEWYRQHARGSQEPRRHATCTLRPATGRLPPKQLTWV